MTTPTARKWLEAAKILAADPSKTVRCPENADGFLRVRDEVFKDDPTMMERYLVCETCGARNVLRMRVPG
jgi:DNA-directed RNA polymerase subunit RPC12/RpoP